MDTAELAYSLGGIAGTIVFFMVVIAAVKRGRITTIMPVKNPKSSIIAKENEKKLGEIICPKRHKLVITEKRLLYLRFNEKRAKFSCNLSDITNVGLSPNKTYFDRKGRISWTFKFVLSYKGKDKSVSSRKWVVTSRYQDLTSPSTVDEFLEIIRERSGLPKS